MDISNVIGIRAMYVNVGYNFSNLSLNLSGWNVSNVTNFDGFNLYVEDKITPPILNNKVIIKDVKGFINDEQNTFALDLNI